MKKILPLLFTIALVCTSCVNYYQVLSLKSIEPTKVSENVVTYSDKDCRLDYDFWADKGNMSFTLFNQTDETMYIYLGETFFVKNGLAMDFLQVKKNRALVYSPENVIAIPAHSYKMLDFPMIHASIFEFCGVSVTPDRSEIVEQNFTQQESPLDFSVRLTYSLGQSSVKKVLKNEFYVSQVVNYHKVNFEQVHTDTIRSCNEPQIIFVQDAKSPDKFYISY